MKYLLILCFLLNQTALAACNWSTDIVKVDANTYQYTKECHGEVGVIGKALKSTKAALEERKKESEALRAEINELSAANGNVKKSLELKDLALQKSDEIAIKWKDEAYNQHERLLKQEKLAKKNNWLYFGGGIGLTILSIWAAGQVRK